MLLQKLLSKFCFDAYFFFIIANQGLIFTDFLMTVVTIFPEEGILSNGNINESLPNKYANIKTLNITFIKHWTNAELVLG